jgi:hypothetical protein
MDRAGLPTLDRPILGTKPIGLPRPNRRYGSTRICEAMDCDTLLSSYNPERRCWLHQPVPNPRTPRGNRER